MVSSPHEALHRIFQEDPALFVRAVKSIGITFDAPVSAGPLPTDLTENRPLERRVDTLTEGKLLVERYFSEYGNTSRGIHDGYLHPGFGDEDPGGERATGPLADPYDRSRPPHGVRAGRLREGLPDLTSERGSRWRAAQFGPDGLAREVPLGHAPTVRQRLHQQQPAAGLRVGRGHLGPGQVLPTGVGHLDAEDRADDVQREPEVAAGNAAVVRGVRRQLGDELPCGVQWEGPGAELLRREQTGETGTAGRGGELHAEVAGVSREFGGVLVHVTQRGRACVL